MDKIVGIQIKTSDDNQSCHGECKWLHPSYEISAICALFDDALDMAGFRDDKNENVFIRCPGCIETEKGGK